jgi:hypothetical protein
LLDRLNPTIAELSQAVEQEVEKCPEAQRLATHLFSHGLPGSIYKVFAPTPDNRKQHLAYLCAL